MASSSTRLILRRLAAVLEAGQLQHAVDDAGDPLGLAADVGEEAGPAAQRASPHWSSSAAPRMAESGLFNSWVSVCTYSSAYCFPSSRLLHAAQRQAEIADLGAAELGERRALPQADAVRVARQAVDRAGQPVGEGKAQQRRDGDGEQPGADEGGGGRGGGRRRCSPSARPTVSTPLTFPWW